ncbi:hypothetical protein Tco_1171786, partial [Tanacetum coccineum]
MNGGNEEVGGIEEYDEDMCQMDDDDLMAGTSMKLDSTLISNDVNKSFNPMMEPDDDWPCQFDGSPDLGKSACQFDASPELGKSATNLFPCQVSEMTTESPLDNGDNGFTFPNGASGLDEEEEVTEIKIRAFLDEK